MYRLLYRIATQRVHTIGVLRRGGMPCARSHSIRGAIAHAHRMDLVRVPLVRRAVRSIKCRARVRRRQIPTSATCLCKSLYFYFQNLRHISETTQICSMIRATGEGATRAPACTRCARARGRRSALLIFSVKIDSSLNLPLLAQLLALTMVRYVRRDVRSDGGDL